MFCRAVEPSSRRAVERERVLTESLTEIKFAAHKEFLEKFKKLKALLAHRQVQPSYAEFFDLLSDLALKQLDPLFESKVADLREVGAESESESTSKSKRRVTPSAHRDVLPLESQSSANKAAPFLHSAGAKCCVKGVHNLKAGSRYIPQKLRTEIWRRDHGGCQFVDELTGRKCESSYALQIDHLKPFALGGETREANLRLLCRSHNQYLAALYFGALKKRTDRAKFSEKKIGLESASPLHS